MREHAFLQGGGSWAGEIARHDWGSTPLGPLQSWPGWLKHTLSLILNSPHPMYLLWGPELLLLFNDAYARYLGSRKVQALGQPFRSWSRNWAELEPIIADALSGKPGQHHDFPIERGPSRRGEFGYFNFSFSPLRDDAGAVAGALCLITETTANVDASSRLKRLNVSLNARAKAHAAERERTWTLSQDLMGVGRYDGRMQAVNPAWGRLLGYSEEAILSRPFTGVLHPDDQVPVQAALRSMRQGKSMVRIETRVRASGGAYRWIAWSGVPEGDVFYITGRDITVGKVALRELEDAQEALRHAHKMEAVGQLTGGIAHDFNNLLQGIVGSLDLIKARIGQDRLDDLTRFIDGAMDSANRASALTHRLLAFSRRQPLDPKAVDGNALMYTMEDLLRRTLGERLQFELSLAPELWLTLCDPNQLESAVLNLAINARDAMPDGGKLIIQTANVRIDSRDCAHAGDIVPGEYVRIAVIDSGAGMSAEVIARAFDPFFTTKPLGQGTGLGLSMIYGFARQSEGHAKIRSEVGKGTTVELLLPRFVGEAMRGSAVGNLSVAHNAEEGEVVIVIEDEAVVRELIVEVLDDLGYTPLQAADGPSGLALVNAAKRVDLLITDIGLPGLNGRQVVDAARLQRPDLKVLFMTGYAENAVAATGFLEHDMQLMTKPFAIEALATRIRLMLGGTMGGAQID